MRNLFKFNRNRLDKERSAGTMSIIVVAMWIGLYTLGQAVALGAGYNLFRQGLLTIGAVYLIINYTDIIFRPLREITNEIQNLQKAAAGIERVESLYVLESKIQSSGQGVIPDGPLGVSFEGVTFGYSDEEPILRDVRFQLQPRQVLGLLGRTGSGKTTITRLLFRLYDPQQGGICLGNEVHQIDLRTATVDDLRRRIGMVTQDVQLFRASVRNNLTFFDRSIPDEQILQVIDELELSDWFQALPHGLDTELETEGTSLSAGEAQLLAFTRVFLKNPGLVILDEASSRLDPATEQLIERAVDKLLQNRTGIIVAHRLKTVERADQIIILDRGQIQEMGRYHDLAHDPNSRFYQLLQTGMEEVLA
jgi:ABC-type multidrug transport system fused ATPase/permease subunit